MLWRARDGGKESIAGKWKIHSMAGCDRIHRREYFRLKEKKHGKENVLLPV